MEKHIYRSVYALKHGPASGVTIQSVYRDIPFRIELLTVDQTKNAHLIALLSAWRKKVLHFIPSTRPITVTGTKEWLQKRVIGEKDRLLFLVVVKDTPIGHVGLYRYNPGNNSMVIDNVIRGVPGYPGVMGEAIKTMMRWAKHTLHIRSFLVDCSSNNEKAIALYKRIGFNEVRREPLILVRTAGGNIFKDAPENHAGLIKYYRVVFRHAGF
jgi:RimJ/RimL family protein N-acetyltransferase